MVWGGSSGASSPQKGSVILRPDASFYLPGAARGGPPPMSPPPVTWGGGRSSLKIPLGASFPAAAAATWGGGGSGGTHPSGAFR